MVKKKSLPTWEYETLIEENANLEFLRDSGLVFDAILFYLSQPHLSDQDREELRQAMQILAARGGI